MEATKKTRSGKVGTSTAEVSADAAFGEEAIQKRIAEKAYELYQNRGETHGHDVDDWYEAERLILGGTGDQEGNQG